MHELGIAAEVLSVALAAAAGHGARSVTRVTLRVGALRAVVPENLAFLFAEAARGSAAEGATLQLEEEPLVLSCPACGPREARAFSLECPACGGPVDRVEGGDTLRVVSIDVDDPPETEEACRTPKQRHR